MSSTYQDLKEHREAVYRVLAKMRFKVIAMEDYVARDARMVEQVLKDVAVCEIYVGIFAWRYGYVPPDGNPQNLSITELEYREAERLKKPRLLFVFVKGGVKVSQCGGVKGDHLWWFGKDVV